MTRYLFTYLFYNRRTCKAKEFWKWMLENQGELVVSHSSLIKSGYLGTTKLRLMNLSLLVHLTHSLLLVEVSDLSVMCLMKNVLQCLCIEHPMDDIFYDVQQAEEI